MSVLFALQCCPLDVAAAMDLADLIAQIPSNPRHEWLIVHRADTPLNRVDFICQALLKRFRKVTLERARIYASGWPAGSNALWRSTMWRAIEMREAGLTAATGVLTFEPDSVPARADWMAALELAYRTRRAPVVGNLHRSPGIEDHINGNAIFPIRLLAEQPAMQVCPAIHAWDYFHRELVLAIAEDTPLITQFYHHTNLSRSDWEGLNKAGVRPALLHGVKDSSARALAHSDLVGNKGLATQALKVA